MLKIGCRKVFRSLKMKTGTQQEPQKVRCLTHVEIYESCCFEKQQVPSV